MYLNRKQESRKCYTIVTIMVSPYKPGRSHKKFWVAAGGRGGQQTQLPQQTAWSGNSGLVGAG